jgi:hypothetical protein
LPNWSFCSKRTKTHDKFDRSGKGSGHKGPNRRQPFAEGIIDTADKVQDDLIVITSHGRFGVDRWVFGSMTEKR